MKQGDIQAFQRNVRQYFSEHGRHELPWRRPESDGSFDPYKILVSEVILQQTQVPRVIPKFEEFLHRFPTVQALADASLGDVLRAWQGLGYNRRAKFLWQAAQLVVRDYGGTFPQDMGELRKLPGIGKNTAAAVYVYSFNKPAVFIETNIRTVYIHHFFKDQTDIPDAAILELVMRTLDTKNPRIWFWALMDYGTFLKQTIGNLSRASKAYVRQSPLEGSRRQIRGQVLKLLAARHYSSRELSRLIPDERLPEVLKMLETEGLIHCRHSTYGL